MKKLFSNMSKIMMSVLLLFCTVTALPVRAKTKTLGDLKDELNKKIDEYNSKKEQKELTSKQIEEVNAKIQSISKTIEQNQQEVVRLGEEIIKLNEDIEKKEQEIKDVVKFYQISSGTSTYLEYIFGATDFTDLIYRLAVSEQLLDYNDKLIDEYNKLIEENKNKQKELANQEESLKRQQESLDAELTKLGSQLASFSEQAVSIEDEIKAQREAIRIYEEEYKCKDDDEISQCTLSKLPADTSFWRPLKTAYRTSEYGYRSFNLNGKPYSDFHTGIDISTYPNNNVPVYSSAAGVVAAIIKRASCGGNQIYIHHNINGKTYTTGYLHLRSINVSVGDVVTKDTQIAVMGGNPNIEYWDKCSTGAHLHFAVSTGLYFKDYSSWSSYVAHTINPRSIVNFPSGGQTFYDRTTKY